MSRFYSFFIVLFSLCATAQQPVSIHLTEKDGLPDLEFYEVIEDNKGFIWLAGNKGLTRFDGREYKTYEHPEKRGLSIFAPFIDHKNRVWCTNISGQFFYVEDDQLILFADLKKDLNGSLAEINVVNDQLFISTYLKHLVYDIPSKKRIIHPIDISNFNYVPPIIFKGKIVNIQKYQLVEITSKDVHATTNLNPNFLFNDQERFYKSHLVPLNNKDLLVFYSSKKYGVKSFILSKDKQQQVTFSEDLNSLDISKINYIDQTLYVLTNEGMISYQLSGNRWMKTAHFFKNQFTTDVIKDKDGNLWITTLKNGIYIIPNIFINNIPFPKNERQSTRIIKGDNEELIIGFLNGHSYKFDTENNQYEDLKVPKGEDVTAICKDDYRKELIIFHGVKNYIASDKNSSILKTEPINISNVKNVSFIDKNTIAGVTSGSSFIAKYPLEGDIREHHIFYEPTRGYTCFYHDTSGKTYFGMVDKLMVVDKNLNVSLIQTKDKRDILTPSIDVTKNGLLWTATFTNGVYGIKNDTVAIHLNESKGLLSNITSSITADGDYLWISTEKGIQRYHTATGSFKNLKKEDGVPSYAIKDMVVGKDHIYFNTTSSIFQVHKEKAFKTPLVQNIYFTDIIINNEPQSLKSQYTLDTSASNVLLNFNVNGLQGISSSLFEYRLLGLQEDWQRLKSGTDNVQFATLPEGDFNFQLRPVNKPKQQVEIAFEVTRHFYKKWWFWSIVVLALIAGIVRYFMWKLRFRESEKNKQLRKLALDSELVSLRLENLRSQMNPHFIFNALNSIQEYIVSNEKNLASSYLVKFSRLIRMYLEQSRENQISLEEEIQAMRLYLELEKVRFEDKLNYEIHIDPSLDLKNIKVPPLFIQPYVENALKHGLLHKKTDRRLEVSFKKDIINQVLSICVKDNGIGRDQAAIIKAERVSYHKSFATYANNERVELLNRKRENKISVEIQDLKTESGIASGTCVCISIPQT